MTPSVSVVVTTRNAAATIVRCLQSVRSQTVPVHEVILVDNNSTDETAPLARPLVDKLLVVGPERSTQRNRGIDAAAGEFVMILDADMELNANVVEECLRTATTERCIVAIPEESFGSGYWAQCKKFERSFYAVDVRISAARFFPRDLLVALGGFDERMYAGEDWDLTIRATRAVPLRFAESIIRHNEGTLRLRQLVSKKFYYGRNLRVFVRKHGREALVRMSPARSAWFSDWRRLIGHPTLSLGLVVMKSAEFSGVLLGMMAPVNVPAVEAPSQRSHGTALVDGPLVSIIIPTIAGRESPARLRRLLLSIERQEYRAIEVIVVSRVERPEIRSIVEAAGGLFLVNGEGKSSARNAGARASRGVAVLHLDEDMEVEETTLSSAVSSLSEAGDAVSIPERLGSSRIVSAAKALEKRFALEDAIVESPRLFRRACYEKLSGFDERLDPLDEGDLRERLLQHGFTFTRSAGFLTVHDDRSWTDEVKHYYARGRLALVFNALHRDSRQLRPMGRIAAYRRRLGQLARTPSATAQLIVLKAVDIAAFWLGTLRPPAAARELYRELTNDRVFLRDRRYREDWHESTVGARILDASEKSIVGEMVSRSGLTSPSVVADVGHGGGRWTMWLRDRFPSARIIAIDKSDVMNERLRSELAGEPRVSVREGTFESLPLRDAECDAVVTIRSLKYTPDVGAAFAEFARVLRASGLLFVEMPLPTVPLRIVRALPWAFTRSTYPRRIVLRSPEELRKIAAGHGFTQVDIRRAFALPARSFRWLGDARSARAAQAIDSRLARAGLARSAFFTFRRDGAP